MVADARTSVVRRFVLVALVAPVVLVAISLAVQVAVLPSLPDPVAVHWGGSGAPDGFGPAWVSPLVTVVGGLGLPALIAATTLPGLRRGGRGPSYRLLGALALALAALIAVLGAWTLAMQSGLTDATQGPGAFPALIGSYAAAVLAGVVGWFVQPRQELVRSEGAAPAPLALAPGERAVWLGTATIARAGAIVLSAALVLLVGATIAVWMAGPIGSAWIVTLVTVLTVVLVATSTAFHVRVDDEGLRVVSVLGLPRFHVPLERIADVSHVFVNPMGEFGGWGLRGTPSRFGVVMRAGDAVEVTQRNGRRFVVTVDDADTAAALLQALVVREEQA